MRKGAGAHARNFFGSIVWSLQNRRRRRQRFILVHRTGTRTATHAKARAKLCLMRPFSRRHVCPPPLKEEPGRGGEGQDARSRPSTKGRSRTHPRLLVGPPHGTTWRTAGAHTAAGQYAGDAPRSCARLAKGAAAHLVVGKEFSHHALSGEGKELGRGTASASEGSAERRAGLQRTGGDAPSKTISGRRSSAASASPLLSRKDDGRGGGVVGTGESQPRRGSCFARADAAGRSLTSLEGRTLFKDEDLEHGQRRRGTGQHFERSLLAALAAQPAEAGEEGGGAAEQTRGVGGRGERAGEADELSQARAPGQDARCRPR